MESHPESSSQPEHHGVPVDLMERLRRANARFHESRRHLEEALASYEMDRDARLDELRRELHDAENEVEEIDRQIHKDLTPPPSA